MLLSLKVIVAIKVIVMLLSADKEYDRIFFVQFRWLLSVLLILLRNSA